MARRSKSVDRQAQIIEVTLGLLAETPLARLTTRQIAKEIGISQPALFRHFRSREQLLLGVMGKARTDLSVIADSVLANVEQPLARLRALATDLLGHVELHPGLARLLFSPPQKGLLRDSLRQMVSMQRALVTQLVKDGQETGVFRPDVNPSEAATYFVGMIQGIVLRHQLEDAPRPLAEEADPMLALWFDGVCSSCEEKAQAQATPPLASEEKTPSVDVCPLDVRPILSAGTDPLETILTALETVRPGGVLMVTAPFRPTPLLRLLGERGHLVVARQTGDHIWSVDVVVGGSPAIHDLLDLEPPDPLERVLEMTASLTAGDAYIARLPRYPRMLVAHLSLRPVEFTIGEADDGTALLHVRATQ